MFTKMAILASAAMLSTVASTADAAVITRTFEGTFTFDSGPITDMSYKFGITYDPAVGLANRKTDYFTTSTNQPAFDGSSVYVSYITDRGEPFFEIDGAGGDGGTGKGALYYDRPDFYIQIYGASLLPETSKLGFSGARYTIGDGTSGYGSRYNTIVETTNMAAAPEPATWAMMIVGFGLTGAAIRRREQTKLAIA